MVVFDIDQMESGTESIKVARNGRDEENVRKIVIKVIVDLDALNIENLKDFKRMFSGEMDPNNAYLRNSSLGVQVEERLGQYDFKDVSDLGGDSHGFKAEIINHSRWCGGH